MSLACRGSCYSGFHVSGSGLTPTFDPNRTVPQIMRGRKKALVVQVLRIFDQGGKVSRCLSRSVAGRGRDRAQEGASRAGGGETLSFNLRPEEPAYIHGL